MQISVIGFDIAKQFFQVHAIDAEGRVAAQVKLRRAQVLDYFRAFHHVLSACGLARQPISGRGSWLRWGTKSG